MKKILLLILLCFFICSNSLSTDLTEIKSKLDLIEKETNTYSGENIPVEKRLQNAELYILGSKKQGDLSTRTDNLYSVLGLPADNKKEEIIYEIENETKANYPAIDKMEKQVLGTTYKKENIYKRIERLEKKLLGKVSSDSLQERVLNLQKKMTPSKISEENPYDNKDKYDYGEYNYYSSKVESPEISIMEKKLLGQNYENEQLSMRLSRLEKKLFGKSFDSESNNVREERLKSVYKAAKSGTEYKVNKFAKYAIAGAQIGGILLLILAMIL